MSSPWREASSLIVIAKSGLSTDSVDYKLLLTKRSGKSSYLAKAFCFPGGHIELADFSSEWWSVFEKTGHNRQSVLNLTLNISKPRPSILTKPLILENVDTKNILPPDIALRISAIRETFEETGILISKSPCQGIDLKEWQKKIHDDASLFPKLFLQFGSSPDIWSLKEWWNWLTPEALGHKRFDTMFYVCCLDAQPKAVCDDNEVSLMEWHSPQYVMQLHAAANSFLAPPQVYELSRLANYKKYENIKAFADNRERFGVDRWCAKITGLKDGAILALPGDDFYETVITSQGTQLPSLVENRAKCKVINRLELRAPVFTAVCENITLPNGHLCPVNTSQPDLTCRL